MYIRVTTPHLQHLSESSVEVREVVGRMEEKDMDLMSRFSAINPTCLCSSLLWKHYTW
jgi:hypothetical protein